MDDFEECPGDFDECVDDFEECPGDFEECLGDFEEWLEVEELDFFCGPLISMLAFCFFADSLVMEPTTSKMLCSKSLSSEVKKVKIFLYKYWMSILSHTISL